MPTFDCNQLLGDARAAWVCLHLRKTARARKKIQLLEAVNVLDTPDIRRHLPSNWKRLCPNTPSCSEMQRKGPFLKVLRNAFVLQIQHRSTPDTIHITMQFLHKKTATLCNKNWHPAAKNQNRSFTTRGATVGLGLGLWLTGSIVLHRRRRNLPFFGNLAEKDICVDDKTVLFRYTYS